MAMDTAHLHDSGFTPDINTIIEHLLREHHVEASTDGEWVVCSRSQVKLRGAIAGVYDYETAFSLQLDIYVQICIGRVVIESFAGMGESKEEAISDALNNFTQNSFHVILTAFCAAPEQAIQQKNWTIGRKPRQVTIGNIGVRGQYPEQVISHTEWFRRFSDLICEKWLDEGTHWVRLYYAQLDGKPQACEVLLDNAPWTRLQSEMSVYRWPRGQGFYSVRVFLVIQGGFDISQAVSIILQALINKTEKVQALIDTGYPRTQAERLAAFVPMAFSHAYFKQFKIAFPTIAKVRYPNMSELIIMELHNEPLYQAAYAFAEEVVAQGTLAEDELEQLVWYDGVAVAIGKALSQGYRPNQLKALPPVIDLSLDDAISESAGYVSGELHAWGSTH